MPEKAAQFNRQYLEEMSGGDEDFIREILCTFFETSQNLLEGLRAAAHDRSAEKAIYVSHTLKGSSRSIGAAPLGALCEDLERLARTGDMDGFAALALQIPAAFAALETEVSLLLSAKAA